MTLKEFVEKNGKEKYVSKMRQYFPTNTVQSVRVVKSADDYSDLA